MCSPAGASSKSGEDHHAGYAEKAAARESEGRTEHAIDESQTDCIGTGAEESACQGTGDDDARRDQQERYNLGGRLGSGPVMKAPGEVDIVPTRQQDAGDQADEGEDFAQKSAEERPDR